MTDREKVIKGLECCLKSWNSACDPECPYNCECRMSAEVFQIVMRDALELLKEQEAEIRQLRLALDIAKGTCKGIVTEGR